MAANNSNTLTKEELESKLVQEIAKKGDQIPERFIVKYLQSIPPAIDPPSNLWEDTLLIDYALLSSSALPGHQNELSKFLYAIKNWGCFQVINHGMTGFLDELMNLSKQFFALPLEEKIKCTMADDIYNGYGNLAIVNGNSKSVNWNDRLYLTLYPEDRRRSQPWPENPLGFREVLHDYSERLQILLQVLLKAMSESLGLPEDRFSNQNGEEASITTRFGFYPRCSSPSKVYGVNPHSDRSTLTILLQDNEVSEALHIQKDDQWFKVPVTPGSLFVNIGDFAEAMSSGIFKSAIHRVMTNSEKERVSVAAFCSPARGTEVEPITELISADQPRKYKKFTMKTYAQLSVKTFSEGKRVLDELRV